MAYLTKPQRDTLKQEIDILIDSQYQSNPEPKVRSSTLLEFEKRKALEPNTNKLLSDWKFEIGNLKIMKLTLAFEPDRTSLQKIWLWASQNIAKNGLF